MKNHWVIPNCQNSEPTKRTVSISANELDVQKSEKAQGTSMQLVLEVLHSMTRSF